MDKAIISSSKNSKVRVFPQDIGNVKLYGFLGKKIKINREKSIPLLYKLFLKHGTVHNFLIASREKNGKIERRLATDSDLYKWIEAVSFDLQNNYDREKEKFLDNLISMIGKAQEKSGYINTFYTEKFRKKRFKELFHSHELYCGGHMIQAAIAHYRATCKENFLKIAIKWADYINRKFGKGGIEENDGHPEVEMALVELYRTTKEKKYLKLAEFMLNQPYKVLGNLPFLKFKEVKGHAVRMMYLCCGATDYYIETGDTRYLKVLLNLWEDMASKKVYITGGIGSRYGSEAFGLTYELPNLRAYAESCAQIASMMWNFRMFCIKGEAKYMDLFETTLYNGFLSSVSLDGTKYFYVNPLASRGEHEREKWYNTTCCPPNIQRMISSLPGYFYCVNKKGIWVNLYNSSEATIPLFSGNKVKILQKTDYPWDGNIEIEIMCEKSEEFSVFLRIPSWSKKAIIKIGNKKFEAKAGNYFELKRTWKREKIYLEMEMKICFYLSHPEIPENRNSVALKRGPLLYCLESIDNQDINLFQCEISEREIKYKFEPSLLGGVGTISGEIFSSISKDFPLYAPEDEFPSIKFKKKRFKAIPYFTWTNRKNSQMIVWVPYEKTI